MNKRAPGLVAFLALALGLALAGALLLLTSFKPYDDEGYVLLSLVNFADGHALYREIYTQYGPFFYGWTDALHRLLRFDFNHVAARGLTLFYWLGAALCSAWIVHHVTRSIRWTLLALAATFAHLWQMTAEPGHPGGLIAFLVALAAWAGAECIARDRPRTLAVLIGLIGAALALTKINVGLFFFAGAGAWLLLHLAPSALARRTPWLAAIGLAVLPWLLMHSLLVQPWVVTFAAIATASALGVVLFSMPARTAWFPLRRATWLIAAAAALALAVVALTFTRGGTLADLLEGVIRGPLRHPGVFFFAVVWRPGALVLALLSFLLVLVAHVRTWTTRLHFRTTVAWLRLAWLAVALVAWFGWLPISALGLVISYGLTALPWFVIPLADDPASLAHARLRSWLALLAVTQALHAYPVGGSQIGWGTFLFAPLLALAAAEAAVFLARRPQEKCHLIDDTSVARPRTRWVASLAALAAFGLAAQLLHTGWQRWRTSEPLRLPGAEILRLPELLSARLRAFALNASVHGNELFSLPGLYSFNLWTGRPTPTLANATHWFSLLNPAQQNQIAARLAADPRALVIVERTLLGFIRASGLPVTGPLHDALDRDFTPVLAAGNYELRARRGRTIAPLSTAHLFAAETAGPEKFQLRLCVYTPPGAQLARIEWLDCADESATRLVRVLDAKDTRAEITPLAPSGAFIGPAVPTAFPATLPRFALITIFSTAPLDQLPRATAVLRLRDAHGALLAEALFAD